MTLEEKQNYYGYLNQIKKEKFDVANSPYYYLLV